jgi:hypothetical protein
VSCRRYTFHLNDGKGTVWAAAFPPLSPPGVIRGRGGMDPSAETGKMVTMSCSAPSPWKLGGRNRHYREGVYRIIWPLHFGSGSVRPSFVDGSFVKVPAPSQSP